MQFLKNKWFWVAIATFIVLLTFSYFFRIPFLKIQPIEAIPSDAVFILDSNENELEKIHDNNALFEGHSQYLQHIKSHLFKDKLEAKELNFLVAGFLSPQAGFDDLYVFNYKINSENIIAEYDFTTSEFRGWPVFHRQGAQFPPITFCIYQNLLLVSPKAFIVEDAIRHLEENKSALLQSELFQSTSTKNNLYLNLEQCQETFKSPKDFGDLIAFQSLISKNKWIGIDIPLTQINQWLKTDYPKNIENKEALIPEDVFFYTRLNLQTDASGPFSWIDAGALLFTTASDQSDWKRPISLLIPFTDEKSASDALFQMAEKIGRPAPIPYLNYDINQLPQQFPFESLLGYKHQGLNKPYFSILDKHVLFSSALEPHQFYLDKLSSDQTLANNIEYLQFKEKHIEHQPPFAYCSEKDVWAWLNSHLRPDIAELILPKDNNFSFYNFRYDKSSIAVDKSLAKKGKDELQPIWKQWLESDASGLAKVLYAPHLEKHFILVQDKTNQLYCFDEQGVKQWKQAINSEILSDFYLVDYQKNGQYQILFNTESTIHLLDFNGKSTGIYPREFRSKASNGLVCFDKDNHKNYVYFLAAKNKKIYGYQLNGSPLSGWNPKEIDYTINTPSSYFFDDKKDYINFVDRKNRLLSFDLKGEAHFPPFALGHYVGQLDNDIHPKSKRFVVAKSKGKLKVINLQGKSFNLAANMPGETQDFLFTDLTGDDRKDYVVLSGNHIKAFGYNEADKFEQQSKYTFDLEQQVLFEFKRKKEDKSCIGVLDKKNKQVHLINSKGAPMDGFPIEATSPLVSFTKNDIQYVISINEEKMICYKY